MSFSKGDIVHTRYNSFVWVVTDFNPISNEVLIKGAIDHFIGTAYPNELISIKSALDTGKRVKFTYDNKECIGTVVNFLDDGSLVIDSDGSEGMVIGVPESDVTHEADTHHHWIPVQKMKSFIDAVKEKNIFDGLVDAIHKDIPAALPPIVPCFECKEWEQASGWVVGKITWACKACGRIKEV